MSTSEISLPDHIAIIMDGNGRWAQRKRLPRVAGHRAGVESVRIVTEECARIGIKQLTLYAFSIDNWNRPKSEVDTLMKYLKEYMVRERERIMKNDIVMKVIGQTERLPDFVRKEMDVTLEMSASNRGMILCLALSYGGREEIVNAARRIAAMAKEGRIDPQEVDEELFRKHLYTAGMKDPDLLIRTAGEKRLSDFLLFQSSYTEFYFTDVCWPDFREQHLMEAIEEYSRRTRKFGRV